MSSLIEKGYLIEPKLESELTEEDLSRISTLFKGQGPFSRPCVVTREIIENLKDKNIVASNWLEFEKTKALYEKGKHKVSPSSFFSYVKKDAETPKQIITDTPPDIEQVRSAEEIKFNNDPKEFVRYYKDRFKELLNILRSRQELQSLTSISRIRQKQRNESVSLVGIIQTKNITRNGNVLLTVEDYTGKISVLINKNKPDIFELAKDLCLDEVVGVEGAKGNNIVFANSVLLPDIPLNKELKKSPEEEYAVFIGDTHVGSNAFMQKEFSKFLQWINGNLGNTKQKDIASKIKYLFVAGDLVEGVGIYPSQEQDLEIKDIYRQYAEFTKYMKQIPPHIKIIICSGNHDAARLAEPQPPVDRDIAQELYAMPNVWFVDNPSTLRIGKKHNFPGFDVLLYHGSSFIYYADAIESIRQAGGLERVDLIAKYLLRRRHLAPTHGSAPYTINYTKDPLLIKTVPDFFVSGHIHRATAKSYRNISILNCSCWIGQTKYQEKVGLKPQPARVPIVNLHTRDTKLLSFLN